MEKFKNRLGKGVSPGHAALYFFIFVWSIVPILWTFRTSIISNDSLYEMPIRYFGASYELAQYETLFSDIKFIRAYGNSIIESVAATAGILIISAVSGYTFARFRFKGKRAFQMIILVTLAIPPYAIMIPLYRNMAKLNIIGSYFSLIAIYIAAFLPLAVWIMTNAFKSIPVEIEEAAQIDGAGKLMAIMVSLPMAKSSIIAVIIISFLSCFSQFIFPMLFSSNETMPVTVLITQFVSKTSVDYSLISAAGILTLIPPAAIALVLNKYLVGGLADGAVK